MHTKFTNVAEFNEELGMDKPHRNIVRLTNIYTRVAGDVVTNIHVICTYLVKGHLIMFKKYCGDTLPAETQAGNEAEEFSQDIQRQIRARCEELGYEVRDGFIEE